MGVQMSGESIMHATFSLVHARHAAPVRIVMVPGWHNSGPAHWQTRWEQRLPQAERVQQQDWEAPERGAWVAQLARTITARPGPVVLVAHSLGCITSVHLPAAVAARVQAALLVAPANPLRVAALEGFAPVPRTVLPYPSVVVGSDNDPYCPLDLVQQYADAWGSELVRMTGAGHINADSGHGAWPEGWEILQGVLQRVASAPPHAVRQPAETCRMCA